MIEFKNVTISYQKEIILKNLNLTIHQGEHIFILGKSGAGKSTLFNALINPQIITKGEILINNQNLKKLNQFQLKKMRRNFGLINQETLLIEDQSLYDNLKLFYPRYNNWFFALIKFINKKQKQEIIDILTRLGLIEHIFARVSSLSGGQKRRVEIALLLLKNSQIILADEPTSGLDVKNAQQIITELSKLNKTLLINLHKLNLIANNKTRIIALANKKLLFDGPFNQLDKEKLKQLYD